MDGRGSSNYGVGMGNQTHGTEAAVPETPPAVSRRSKRTHGAILAAAEKLLAEKGYANVTIEGIAAQAGAGKQTIYRWWSSKADLYMELYSELADRDIHLPDTGSVDHDLRQLFYQLFKFFRHTGAGGALPGIIAEIQSEPGLAKAFYEVLVKSRRRLWREILDRGVERGEIKGDLNLELIVDILNGPVWYRRLLGHAPLNRRFADDLVRVVMGGIQA